MMRKLDGYKDLLLNMFPNLYLNENSWHETTFQDLLKCFDNHFNKFLDNFR